MFPSCVFAASAFALFSFSARASPVARGDVVAIPPSFLEHPTIVQVAQRTPLAPPEVVPVPTPFPASMLEHWEVRRDIQSDDSPAVASHNYGLRDAESFYWAIDGLPAVNFTAWAHQANLKILSLERHIQAFKRAECSRNSIQLSLGAKHFAEARQAWRWVNDAVENTIVLVTDSVDCNLPDGDPSLRQPWDVNRIAFNDKDNTITFTDVKPLSWESAFSDWRLRGSSKGLLPVPSRATRLRKRAQTASVDITQDFSNIGVTIDGLTDASLSIACNPCKSQGALTFEFDLKPQVVPTLQLTGYFKLSTQGVAAEVAARLQAAGPLVDGKTFSSPALTVPLPGAGIAIGGIVDLGFTLNFKLEGNIGKIDAAVTATAGLKVVIPDQSVYVLNIGGSTDNGNSATAPQVEPILDISSDVAIGASIGPVLSLDLEAKVLGLGAGIGLALAGPTLEVEAKALSNSNGACGVPSVPVGVEFDLGIGVSVYAVESADLVVATPAATQTIFATDFPLFTTCVGLPGVTLPPLPTTPPYPTGNGTLPYGTIGTGLNTGVTLTTGAGPSVTRTPGTQPIGTQPVRTSVRHDVPSKSSSVPIITLTTTTTTTATAGAPCGLPSDLVPSGLFDPAAV